VAEKELWQKAGVKPEGSWYKVYDKGSEGNAPTLKFTDQQKGYTVIDRATYLSLKNAIKLQVLVEGDEALLNRISLIPVNPRKFPRVNAADTAIFVAWLCAPDKGQRVVAEFGKEKYGDPLFFPDSREWHAAQAVKK
jgi:tungstate transport system substrate-binding protein